MEKVNVGLMDIFNYINSSRPIREGEAVFNAGHVTLCGVKEDAVKCNIVGFCLQTSNLNGPPHKIDITLEDNVKDWKATCTCKAGLGGKCKHITAVLIHANRVGEVEKLSCTDIEQIWGKVGMNQSLSKDSFDYSTSVKLVDYCHPVSRKPKLNPEVIMKEIDKSNFEILKICDSNSSITKILEGRQMTVVEQKQIGNVNLYKFDNILALLKKDNKILNIISMSVEDKEKTKFYKDNIENPNIHLIYNNSIGQQNDFWIETRKFRITGSNCYHWHTYSKNTNPDWAKKINCHINLSFRGNAATRHGKDSERIARKMYEKTSNQKVMECGLIIN